jgi:GTP-binding protein HflX
MVYNKVDLLKEKPRIERDASGMVSKVLVSSINGAGKDLLFEAIAERIGEAVIETNVKVSPREGRMRAQFFELGAVLEERPCEDGSVEMRLRIQESSLRKITQNKRAVQSFP